MHGTSQKVYVPKGDDSMKRHLFTLPTCHSDQIIWLEELVTGPCLDEVVSDLKASGIKDRQVLQLSEILGSNYHSVQESGLGCLNRTQVRLLLANPDSLVDLQEMVLVEGADYWIVRLLRENDEHICKLHSESSAHGRGGINRGGGGSGLVIGITGTIFALAASILLFFRLWHGWGDSEKSVDWGWARVGALPVTKNRTDYLLALASVAEEWFDKTPATPTELYSRISNFQQGCAVILAARHDPLPQTDRVWLRERCEAWNQKLMEAAEELRKGKQFDDVVNSVDAIARNLCKALRERSRA